MNENILLDRKIAKNKNFTISLILYKERALVLGVGFEKSWKLFPPFDQVHSCGRHGCTANIVGGLSGTQRGQNHSGWPFPEDSACWIHGLPDQPALGSHLWWHWWLLHQPHTAALKPLPDWPRCQSLCWVQPAVSNILKQCWTYKEKMAQEQEEKKG